LSKALKHRKGKKAHSLWAKTSTNMALAQQFGVKWIGSSKVWRFSDSKRTRFLLRDWVMKLETQHWILKKNTPSWDRNHLIPDGHVKTRQKEARDKENLFKITLAPSEKQSSRCCPGWVRCDVTRGINDCRLEDITVGVLSSSYETMSILTFADETQCTIHANGQL